MACDEKESNGKRALLEMQERGYFNNSHLAST